MNKTVEILTEIVKHLPGQHDQAAHAGEIRGVLKNIEGQPKSKDRAFVSRLLKTIKRLPPEKQNRFEVLRERAVNKQFREHGAKDFDAVLAYHDAAEQLASEIESGKENN